MPIDSALHKACHNGKINEVISLLQNGDHDVNEIGAGDRRPLHRAAGSNHVNICEFLVANGARINQTDKAGRTALHWAAISGHKEAVQYLIEQNANIYAETSTKMTALHGAAEGGRVEVIRYMLDKKENERDILFDLRDADDKTPFILAFENKHQNVLKLLKDYGDPNAKSASCVIM